MVSGKKGKFKIQKLQGLGFYRNDKQKILYDFFSIMFNCLKVIYPKLYIISFQNIARCLT